MQGMVNEMINEAGDDRNSVLPNDKVLLVVEDDLRFGKIIIDKAHERGLKAIVATNYLEVFDFINRFMPICHYPRCKVAGYQWVEGARPVAERSELSPYTYSSYIGRGEQRVGPEAGRPEFSAQAAR